MQSIVFIFFRKKELKKPCDYTAIIACSLPQKYSISVESKGFRYVTEFVIYKQTSLICSHV